MAATNTYARINFRKEQVLAEVEKAKTDSLKNIGLAIEGQAKVNIVENDQVDTGFMVNSGYFKMRGFSSFGSTSPTGKYAGERGGGERKRAPEAGLPSGKDALVGFAAIYAIYQEERRSFLYRAGEQVVGKVGGLIRRV